MELVLNMGIPNRRRREYWRKSRCTSYSVVLPNPVGVGLSISESSIRAVKKKSDLLSSLNLSEFGRCVCGVCGTEEVEHAEPADLMRGEKSGYRNVNGNFHLPRKSELPSCGGNGKERHCIGWKKKHIGFKRTDIQWVSPQVGCQLSQRADCSVCGYRYRNALHWRGTAWQRRSIWLELCMEERGSVWTYEWSGWKCTSYHQLPNSAV